MIRNKITNKTSNAANFTGVLICAIGAIFYAYQFVLRVEPGLMSSELMRHFNVSFGALGAMVSLYYYAYSSLQLIVGILTDKYGTRLILTIAVIACAIGSFIFSIANNLYLAGCGRFLIGCGSAFSLACALKLAAEWMPKHLFALFTGGTIAFGMFGAMLSNMGLPILINKFGWQSSLHVVTILGVILIPVVWILVRDKNPKFVEKRSDVKISRETYFSGFVKMLKNPQMWLNGVVSGLLYLPLSVFAELWGIPFLRAVYHLDLKTAAFVCSMVYMGWLFGSPINGWLSDRNRTRKLPLIIGGFFAVVIISAIVIKPFDIPLWLLYVLLFLFGFSASSKVVCFAIGREHNTTDVVATAVGFTTFLTMVCGAILQPLVGIFLDLAWNGQMSGGIRVYTATEFDSAFWILPLLILCGVILSLFIKETYHMNHDL